MVRYRKVALIYDEFQLWTQIPADLRSQVVGSITNMRWKLAGGAFLVFMAAPARLPSWRRPSAVESVSTGLPQPRRAAERARGDRRCHRRRLARVGGPAGRRLLPWTTRPGPARRGRRGFALPLLALAREAIEDAGLAGSSRSMSAARAAALEKVRRRAMSGSGRPKPGAKPSGAAPSSPALVTVAVLAAVIIGVAALSPSDERARPRSRCRPLRTRVRSVDRARRAGARGGGEAGAAALANQALKADPTNQAARALLTKATAAQQATPGSRAAAPRTRGHRTARKRQLGPEPGHRATPRSSRYGQIPACRIRQVLLGRRSGYPKRGPGLSDTGLGTQIARQITWTVHEGESKTEPSASCRL